MLIFVSYYNLVIKISYWLKGITNAQDKVKVVRAQIIDIVIVCVFRFGVDKNKHISIIRYITIKISIIINAICIL